MQKKAEDPACCDRDPRAKEIIATSVAMPSAYPNARVLLIDG